MAFERWDRVLLKSLGLQGLDRRGSATVFELAYMLCYPVVPLGLAALYLLDMREYADSYWLTVLLSAYPCYALLPFVQLLPPRSFRPPEAPMERAGRLRRLNLWIMRHVSHQANTFPSGHVAASMAIAFVVFRLSALVGSFFLLIAAGIALGCVAGRYHYAVDVAAAMLLAVSVFAIV
jgi:membrane-associated phospholipid phosphatase